MTDNGLTAEQKEVLECHADELDGWSSTISGHIRAALAVIDAQANTLEFTRKNADRDAERSRASVASWMERFEERAAALDALEGTMRTILRQIDDGLLNGTDHGPTLRLIMDSARVALGLTSQAIPEEVKS